MKFYQVICDDNVSGNDNPVSNKNIYMTKSQAIQEVLTEGFILIPDNLKSISDKYSDYKFYKPFSSQPEDYTEYADIVELTLVEHDVIMDNLTIETIDKNTDMIEKFLNNYPNLEVSEVDL
ncbi:hypothetical protein [Enterococcus casseliflavus]|uniref:hypothetical protein n=1 Tax=Enterococcus casseliflavus TaxID=37734 RepID=UPI003018FA04